MAVTRKPKKVLIQFFVAFLAAVVLGVLAITAGYTVISGFKHQSEVAVAEAEKLAAEAEDEKRRLKAAQESQQQAVKTFKVVQALTNLEPGQAITQDMVRLVTSEERPPAGSLSMISHALGKVVKAPIVQGEPLDSSKLLDTGYIIVRDGMRAITISVDMIGGLNGALVAGSHVDILTSVQEGDTTLTETLLQNIEVASVGSSLGSTRPATAEGLPVTVMVTPQQAQKLALASGLGKFHLTLRNFHDRRNLRIPAEDLTALMTGLQPAEKQPPKAVHSRRKPLQDTGFQNVNYTPEGAGLPSPLNSASPQNKYSMQIYRGTGAESVDFQQ